MEAQGQFLLGGKVKVTKEIWLFCHMMKFSFIEAGGFQDEGPAIASSSRTSLNSILSSHIHLPNADSV